MSSLQTPRKPAQTKAEIAQTKQDVIARIPPKSPKDYKIRVAIASNQAANHAALIAWFAKMIIAKKLPTGEVHYYKDLEGRGVEDLVPIDVYSLDFIPRIMQSLPGAVADIPRQAAGTQTMAVRQTRVIADLALIHGYYFNALSDMLREANGAMRARLNKQDVIDRLSHRLADYQSVLADAKLLFEVDIKAAMSYHIEYETGEVAISKQVATAVFQLYSKVAGLTNYYIGNIYRKELAKKLHALRNQYQNNKEYLKVIDAAINKQKPLGTYSAPDPFLKRLLGSGSDNQLFFQITREQIDEKLLEGDFKSLGPAGLLTIANALLNLPHDNPDKFLVRDKLRNDKKSLKEKKDDRASGPEDNTVSLNPYVWYNSSTATDEATRALNEQEREPQLIVETIELPGEREGEVKTETRVVVEIITPESVLDAEVGRFYEQLPRIGGLYYLFIDGMLHSYSPSTGLSQVADGGKRLTIFNEFSFYVQMRIATELLAAATAGVLTAAETGKNKPVREIVNAAAQKNLETVQAVERRYNLQKADYLSLRTGLATTATRRNAQYRLMSGMARDMTDKAIDNVTSEEVKADIRGAANQDPEVANVQFNRGMGPLVAYYLVTVKDNIEALEKIV